MRWVLRDERASRPSENSPEGPQVLGRGPGLCAAGQQHGEKQCESRQGKSEEFFCHTKESGFYAAGSGDPARVFRLQSMLLRVGAGGDPKGRPGEEGRMTVQRPRCVYCPGHQGQGNCP